MWKSLPLRGLILVLPCIGILVLGWNTRLSGQNNTKAEEAQSELERLCQCDGNFGPLAPVLDPRVQPIDVSLRSNESCRTCQPCFDCFGWQWFIALNWLARDGHCGEPDTEGYFGQPGDVRPVVWESYKGVYDVFRDTKPDPWCRNGERRHLSANSAVIHLRDERQADHNWLSDWDSNVVYYEIRINEDEFNYIMKHNLYNQEGLYTAFSEGAGIDLPDSTSAFGPVGAVEIKAAWRIVPMNRLLHFIRYYKVSMATIEGRGNDPVPVALVGLHIIKKSPKSPQWIWATFEHKDNAPDSAARPDPNIQYNFYNPQAARDYKPNYKSPPNQFGNPPTPMDRPVQVMRTNPIDPQAAMPINRAMHRLIAARYPRSVWVNYNLVDVQWPKEPEKIDPKTTVVLPAGLPRPEVVTNLTMETYLQMPNSGGGAGDKAGSQDKGDGASPQNKGKSSCIGCHRSAAVTPTFEDHPNKWWYTDYSNIFYKAKAHK